MNAPMQALTAAVTSGGKLSPGPPGDSSPSTPSTTTGWSRLPSASAGFRSPQAVISPAAITANVKVTATAVSLSRRAIARANPGLSPQEIGLKFVELHYGKELASRVRRYLEGRS